MMKKSEVVAVLRKDASYVWRGIVAAILLGFVGVALAAAVLDVLSFGIWAMGDGFC